MSDRQVAIVFAISFPTKVLEPEPCLRSEGLKTWVFCNIRWSSELSHSILLLIANATLRTGSAEKSKTLPSEQRPLLPGIDVYRTPTCSPLTWFPRHFGRLARWVDDNSWVVCASATPIFHAVSHKWGFPITELKTQMNQVAST